MSEGCLPSVLRRVLCFGSLPTCALDCLEKVENEKLDSSFDPSSCGPTPGLVARLMGLESLPLVERSSSGNSRDSCCGLGIPITYQEDEDEEFYIFSFEYPRKRNKKKKKRRVSGNKDDFCRESGRKKEATKTEYGTEDGSENSSPNSVLEFVEFQADDDRQASCSGDDDSRMSNLRMRRTLSEELERCEKSGKKLAVGEEKLRNRYEISVCGGKWKEIIGEEVIKMRWVGDEILRNKEHMKEIGRDLSCEILDQLLDDLLISLVVA
ncbi:AMP-dependent synthetase and ligase family protein [Striga asiatica]|uniref:AMP-dependent synthetase and ligase family protein n=1 Tax=Striga asiatica TaxID=4170 RepID=A0A5A7P5K1_STRAF|nr:AMP-dependent synthetase and ligase family protein [Striga asiatica]